MRRGGSRMLVCVCDGVGCCCSGHGRTFEQLQGSCGRDTDNDWAVLWSVTNSHYHLYCTQSVACAKLSFSFMFSILVLVMLSLVMDP